MVPDLTPEARPELKGTAPAFVFVAESPHVAEVTPEALGARRPLCGPAGRKWWGMLGALLDGDPGEDVSIERMVRICRDHRVAILNAVQYPLDPGITRLFGQADPAPNLGFAKVAGEWSYKKQKASAGMRRALDSLKARLGEASLADADIYCLGGDAEWFVRRALGDAEFARRVRGRIPHPSAWWRKGGLFRDVARAKLAEVLERELPAVTGP